MSAVEPSNNADAPVVVSGPGLPILDDARWTGNSCWAELRLVELITGWMAVEPRHERSLHLWTVRADAAKRGEMWFERLPMLREFPRSEFIKPTSDQEQAQFEAWARLDDPDNTGLRNAALSEALIALRERYEAHCELAVGPADGPTRWALAEALRSL